MAMTVVRAPIFGRRGQRAAPAVRPPVGAPVDGVPFRPKPTDENFTVLARQMLREGDNVQYSAERPGEVPWSMTAATLAGVAGSCLLAGLYIVAAKGPVEIIPGLKMTLGGSSQMLLLAIVLGLWNGAQIAVTATMVSHMAMRFVQMTSPTAYAIAGGISGAVYDYGMAMLTGESSNVLVTAATGLAAGFLYRRFAGLRSG
ncbi:MULTISPECIES: hypothetical protein [unclassified Beijerinckia]|uniref:hypothetical protein n=1 Tax=unclassified Beijerinckia TaxID=2638183 RepID=UPI001114F87A|nr:MULTISPECIES: hypothetical protein [unclassified Beijerinckia]MDH7799789.1 hypothetical protein [Beijerinckia sp. GAS462]